MYRRTHDVHDTEDLVQETFARAYQNLGDYRDSWRFSTWLYTIARRLAISHHRKAQARGAAPPAMVSAPSPSDVLSDREQRDTLWAMARGLPEHQYQALWLKYAEGLSVKEIAKAMGKSQINVKVLLYRARTDMAKRWQQDDPGEPVGRSQ